MESTLMEKKIANLPDNVKQQVSDYIDFLVEKYSKENSNLTEAEKQTLEMRYGHYLNHSQQATDLEEVKNHLLRKHGLSSKG